MIYYFLNNFFYLEKKNLWRFVCNVIYNWMYMYKDILIKCKFNDNLYSVCIYKIWFYIDESLKM